MKTKFSAGLIATGISIAIFLLLIISSASKSLSKGVFSGIVILSWCIIYFLLKPKEKEEDKESPKEDDKNEENAE